jgi:acetyl-CoA carboxylase biotin carboxyl carrier protein
MDLNYVRRLIKLVAESGVTEIEIEEEGKRIRVAKSVDHLAVTAQPTAFVNPFPLAAPPLPEPKAEKKTHEITSPIVGTFYRAPAPDADSYVQVGQEVHAGTALCIIEAMKLMNEIESDVAGKIVKIHVENGQPVEYNQPLFSIELT